MTPEQMTALGALPLTQERGRAIAYCRTYHGVNIYYDRLPGRLPWTTIGYGAADTLAGMKRLIRGAKGLS